MIIHKALLPILLFVRSELAEKVDDPCSEFQGGWTDNGSYPLVKCPSEKPDEDYLECYDAGQKENWEKGGGYTALYWCWSRQESFLTDADPRNLTISAVGNDYDGNSRVIDIINRPFTARFYVNDTHITCQENEEWVNTILGGGDFVYCSTSTGYWAAHFSWVNGFASG